MSIISDNNIASDVACYADVAMALAEFVSAANLSPAIADALGSEDVSSGDLYNAFIRELPPFASIYLSTDGNIGGDPRSTIAGFYRALSLPIPADPDHLSHLLSLLAGILSARDKTPADQLMERKDSIDRAAGVVLHDHLLSWLPAYLLRAQEVFPPSLGNWVSITFDLLSLLSLQYDTVVSSVAGFRGELSQVGDPNQIVRWLTSPGLSGLIISLGDIEEVARKLELPLRAGRKRFVLQEMVSQASNQVLSEFQALAKNQSRLFDSQVEQFSSLKGWAARASQSADLLASII